MDLQKQLDLFEANPPRLWPHQPEQRVIIENHLRRLAAMEPERYEEFFERYNRKCDELGVQRFGRVTVVAEETPAPPVEETSTVEVPVEESKAEPEVPQDVKVEPVEGVEVQPPKKKRKKKTVSDSPSAQ